MNFIGFIHGYIVNTTKSTCFERRLGMICTKSINFLFSESYENELDQLL